MNHQSSVLILAVLFFTLAVPAFAQDDEDPNACTDAHVDELKSILVEHNIVEDFTSVVEEIETATDLLAQGNDAVTDTFDLLQTVDSLQQVWWTETSSDFPDCTTASFMRTTIGRAYDELTLVITN